MGYLPKLQQRTLTMPWTVPCSAGGVRLLQYAVRVAYIIPNVKLCRRLISRIHQALFIIVYKKNLLKWQKLINDY